MKQWLINWFTKHLLIVPLPTEVIFIQQDKAGKTIKMQLGTDIITESQRKMLHEEAKMIVNTRLWSVITNSTVEHAKQRMFELSKTNEDMLFGKGILYTVDLQKKLVQKFLDN